MRACFNSNFFLSDFIPHEDQAEIRKHRHLQVHKGMTQMFLTHKESPKRSKHLQSLYYSLNFGFYKQGVARQHWTAPFDVVGAHEITDFTAVFRLAQH